MDNSLKTINEVIEYVNTVGFTNVPLDTNVLGIKERLLTFLTNKRIAIVNTNTNNEERTDNM
jgi:hypothetical protein